jgi:uncharacterized integral membrane protein
MQDGSGERQTRRFGMHKEEDDGRDRAGDGERAGGDWVERREGPNGKLIAVGIVGVILLLFVVQNTDRTHFDFLFLDGEFPLWTMIVAGAVLGFVAGWAFARIRARRRVDRGS